MATRPTLDLDAIEVEALIKLTREAAINNESEKRVSYQYLADRLINHKHALQDYRYNTDRKAR